MKVEVIERLNAVQVQEAHAAYTKLAAIYEDVCNGPMNARQYKEYFAIMDAREALRKRFYFLTTGNDETRQ